MNKKQLGFDRRDDCIECGKNVIRKSRLSFYYIVAKYFQTYL
jgi:hypothetical protein